jgi:radical SAM superfamily enzyme YgiQ (UPF0313 family)
VADILLTHSYHLFYDHKQVRKMQPYPPLGTLYAAALLRQQGFSVAFFDTMLEDPERGFPDALRRHRPRVVALYEDNFNFLSKMCLTRMRELAYTMMEAARQAGAAVVVNGSDASDHTGDYLRQGADFVLAGEAEWTLLELTAALTGGIGPELRGIQGIAYAEDGRVHRTPPRPLTRQIDTLPMPARDLVNMDRYWDAWRSAHGFFSLNLVASRGCPYHCNWCAKPIYGQTFHLRSAVSVAEEMRELKAVYGADHLWFADDVFGLHPDWIPALAASVARYSAQVPFKMQSRADLMTERSVQALGRMGCQEVWMGVESGSQKILDAMDKGLRVEEVISARERLGRHGIRACFFLQLGYPGEGWDDIRKTIRLVLETRPDDIGVSVSYPLPGTLFYGRVRTELGEKRNWVDSDDLAVMFNGTYTNQFYRAVRDALHAEVDRWNAARHLAPGQTAQPATDPIDLWKRVAELERTCRNEDPSLAAPGPGVRLALEPLF